MCPEVSEERGGVVDVVGELRPPVAHQLLVVLGDGDAPGGGGDGPRRRRGTALA